jgi:glycosyltransferase involved in cell wall biosynthesis
MSLDPTTGGGTAERTLQISLALTDVGHDCTILTTDLGMTVERRLQLNNIRLIALPCLCKRLYLFKFSLSELRAAVLEANIIHLMSHWTFINALVYLLTICYKKPYAVCPAGALPVFGRSKFIKKLYNVVVGRAIIRNAFFHIAIADNELSHFAEYGVPATKVSLIPNGVNPVDFTIHDHEKDIFRKHAGLDSNPYILFMGRLNVIKGPDLLLQAFLSIFDRFPDVHLVFAGPDGGMLQTLKEQISTQEQKKRIHFVGHIAGNIKASAYSSALLLVVPSRQEAMSIVALESGVCGVPVLMTDQCGFGTLSDIGGGMVVLATVDALSEGLVSLLENRSNLPSMGERFKTYILEHYTWHAAAIAYLGLFNEMEKIGV